MSAALRLGERLNPVLVKEVRAALRGKLFRISFLLVTGIALLISFALLGSMLSEQHTAVQGMSHSVNARSYLAPLLIFLAIAVLGVVPLSTFFSLGAEFDEHTFELLSLSDLRPRHIVLGKLGAAAVEIALYFAAFLPFVMFGLMLPGVAALDVVLVLASLFIVALGCAALALALSSVTRQRVVRVLLLAATALGAVLANLAFYEAILQDVVERGRGFGSSLGTEGCTLLVFVCVFGTWLGVALASVRLAHPEEDRSSALRVFNLALVVASLAPVVWIDLLRMGGGSAGAISVMLLVVTFVMHTFFTTEPEALSRHARVSLPTSSWRAVLAAPFLPGGGRGLWSWLLHGALIVGSIWLANVLGRVSPDEAMAVSVFAAYPTLYLFGVSVCFARASRRLGMRVAARVLIALVAVGLIVVPGLIVAFLGGSDSGFELPTNPFWVIGRWHNGHQNSGSLLFVLLALIALVVNTPRLRGAIVEVLHHSRARRRRTTLASSVPPMPRSAEASSDAQV